MKDRDKASSPGGRRNEKNRTVNRRSRQAKRIIEIVQEKFPGNPELQVFRHWVEMLNRSRISYLLGGAFAVCLHTGSWRDTKDMDVFLQAKDLGRALGLFAEAGYRTEILSPNWLAKVFHGDYFADLIFGFWNGRLTTMNRWLERNK